MFRKRVVVEHGDPPVYRDTTAVSPASSLLAGLVSFLVGVVEVILILRLVFRWANANAANGFVNFIYNASHPLIAPFAGIFHTPAIGSSTTGTFEVATLVAIVIYALIGWLLITLFNSFRTRY